MRHWGTNSSRSRIAAGIALLATVFVASAAEPAAGPSDRLPSVADWLRVISLRDHNTRVVVIGAALLGLSAGVLGTFLLLRKRSLLADALSHATLPGIAIAFMVMVAAGGSGKNLAGLLIGAGVFGVLGMLGVALLRRTTRLKEDAALGIVLSVLFGLGTALLGIIQNMPAGSAAGLESFIYGKTASMVARDAWLIAAAGAAVVVLCLVLFKEFKLLCFDPQFGGAQGWPIGMLDLLLMTAVVVVTVVGLQAVGLILVIALVVIPPAAARFWTEDLRHMVWIAGLIGAVSGLLGAGASALLARLPAGAIIVLVAALAFLISMVFGGTRGLLVRAWERIRLRRRIARQHVLRAAYEALEARVGSWRPATAPAAELPSLSRRDFAERAWWSEHQRRAELRRAERDGVLASADREGLRLTALGLAEARRVVRNHRLWELFLIRYAEIAPSHVDRDADMIEHVLSAEIIAELEAMVEADERGVPSSPHALPARRTVHSPNTGLDASHGARS